MPARVLVTAVLVVLGLLAAPRAAEGAWRWPVRGDVATPFAVSANPFARGQHRGIDILAPAGAPVVAACTGRVRFAGALPRRGRVVSLACGPLVASHLELGAVSVRRGDLVRAGRVIGTVAASHVQLGARRLGHRFGYVDPMTLLAGDPPPPTGAAPPARRPARRPPQERPLRAPSPAAGAEGSPAAARPPMVAWVGVALLLAGLPAGTVARRRRRRAGAARAVGQATA